VIGKEEQGHDHCKEKKDTLVKLTLPEDANIYASAYELYLPDKKLLQAKVKEWVNEFESTNAEIATARSGK